MEALQIRRWAPGVVVQVVIFRAPIHLRVAHTPLLWEVAAQLAQGPAVAQAMIVALIVTQQQVVVGAAVTQQTEVAVMVARVEVDVARQGEELEL